MRRPSLSKNKRSRVEEVNPYSQDWHFQCSLTQNAALGIREWKVLWKGIQLRLELHMPMLTGLNASCWVHLSKALSHVKECCHIEICQATLIKDMKVFSLACSRERYFGPGHAPFPERVPRGACPPQLPLADVGDLTPKRAAAQSACSSRLTHIWAQYN